MNTQFRTLPIVALLILLSACSRNDLPKWLSGEWTYDVEATMENFRSGNSAETSGALDTMRAGLIPMLNGMEMVFSGTDLIISFQGERKLSEFEIYERGSDTITIKHSDGVLRDFNKTGDGFWTLSDDGQIKMYFKRKDSASE